MADLRFDNRVAIVTGAGNGLGRSHALFLASRGAKVVVNDLGGGFKGEGKSSAAADKVVEEIKAAGGQAVANYDSVEDGDKIVKTALDAFGGVDIVINNAGILRDTSFQKMTDQDWDLIVKVHLNGAYKVTKAAWDHMRDKGYGRIIFTTSAAGIYGNFGQANYSAAKLALVGLMQTLAIEGKKKNVFANAIGPIAGSRMTETVLPPDLIAALKPEFVTPLVAYLCHESCEENGGTFEVGGGFMGKLRWERAEGELFRISRAITPEQVKASWGKIAGFAHTTHPSDITASMQPILGNLSTAKTKGGNEFIDLDLALGYEAPPVESSYDERDVALYALGVGAAHDPLDDADLQTVYELHGEGMKVLPTFGVVPILNVMMKNAREGKTIPGLNYGFDRVLHGEQFTEVKYPLPTHAKLTHKVKVKDIFDKGKNALVVTSSTSYDEDGNEVIYNELTTFVRGAGGWGGERGPSADVNVPPTRAPDAVMSEKIPENQALLYRLSGDWNPLHADPSFAKNFGFQKPILHGLCSYGIAARHVIKSFCKGDPRLFKSIKARFADTVFPGETLKTEMWKEGNKVIFRCRVEGKEKDAISNAAVELYEKIPTRPAKKSAAAPSASAGASAGGGGDPIAMIFGAIRGHVDTHKDLTKIGKVFQFNITDPSAKWVVDLKEGKVFEGTAAKADTTLELSQSDWLAMATGQANPQKLYFGGKLKITGDVMASQKLDFLKDVKPAPAGASTSATPAAAPAGAGELGDFQPIHVFAGMRDHIEKHPELIAKVATVYQWKLTNPESFWILDLKNGKGKVEEGKVDKPDTTLELTQADFLDMSAGKADPQKLYFGGKLKIGGNLMASQKLEFLKSIDKEAAKAAAMKVTAQPSKAASASASPAPAAGSKVPEILAALKDRLAKNAGLAKEIGGTLQFKVGDHAFSVSANGFAEGLNDKREATLTFKEEDAFVTLVQDASKETDLFMHGQIRVDGNVQLAKKIAFLNKLV